MMIACGVTGGCLLVFSSADAATPSPAPASGDKGAIQQSAVASGSPARAKVEDVIGMLNDAQLDQAVDAIKANYLQSSAMSEIELKRARLEGLLDRMGPGGEIVAETAVVAAEPVYAFVAEILDGRIGYIRPGKLDNDRLAEMDAVLKGFTEKKIPAVILDLRGIGYSSDFEAAANFARRFSQKGQLLFRVEKPNAKQERIFTSNQDPEFAGTLVVLTDHQTAGAAEVLAAALRAHAKALIVGEQTAGKAVEFSTFSLGSGLNLRVAVAEAVIPDRERLFPKGVTPDIPSIISPKVLDTIFRQSVELGVSGFVFEKERPRMNEAALIANINPEIDGSGNGGHAKENPKDTVLQRAVDIVTAITLFKSPK